MKFFGWLVFLRLNPRETKHVPKSIFKDCQQCLVLSPDRGSSVMKQLKIVYVFCDQVCLSSCEQQKICVAVATF